MLRGCGGRRHQEGPERSRVLTSVRMLLKAVVKEGRMSLSCHHRGISRMKAEELLLERKEDGSFLVRDSETIPNAYTLCVLYQGCVKQYRILPDSEGMLYIQAGKGQERKYVDLLQLIHETVQRADRNCLVCPLKYPVAVEVEEDEKDSEEEDDCPAERSGEGLTSAALTGQPTPAGREFPDRANVEMISTFFTSRLAKLDMSIHDSEFITRLRDYADEGVHRDIVDVTSGGEEMKELRQIVSDSAKDLEKQVNIFLSKMDTCRQLFGYASSPVVNQKNDKQKEKGKVDLPEVLDKCSQCKSTFSNLEKRALKTLQELKSKDWEVGVRGNIQPSRPPPRQDGPEEGKVKKDKTLVPPMTFKARLQKHGKPGPKMKLMVDIHAGKFFAVKDSSESLDESNVFFHDKITQVIKCSANNCRLDMLIEGRKKESYLFEDVWSRETFCQMIQELKTFHASSQQVDHLSVFVGSWNMGSEVPPLSLGSWLKSQGIGKERSRAVGLIPHDLYVIGTQESALTEKDWVNRVKASLQETIAYDVHDMHTVITVSMWSLRLVVLVRSDYKNKISHLQHSTVKTGIANKLGNKGAIGVSFQFDGTAFCFVNCHLTSGHERNAKRNQNVHDIIKGLQLGQKSSVYDITNQFHHVFFLGDLNYRLAGIEPQEIIKKVTQERVHNTNKYAALLDYDQLRKSQHSWEVFYGFNEEDITFPPTYRFEKGSAEKYAWQKFKKTGTRINAPSWCDRVIWKSYPETYIKNTSYGMVEDVKTSDHKPLFASFDVGITSQTVSKGKELHSGMTTILFEEVTAEVKTTSKETFKVEFHSNCLEGTAMSEQNEQFVSSSHAPNHVCPRWTALQLPQIMPIFDDRAYLEDQHILVAVKTADGMESFGECVIALKAMFSVKPEPFESILTHKGEATGKIKGLMSVRMSTPSQPANYRRRKSYELICLDTDMPKLLSSVSFPAALLEDSHFEMEADTPPVPPKEAPKDPAPPLPPPAQPVKRPLSGPERHRKGQSDLPRGSPMHEVKAGDLQARRSVFEPVLTDDGPQSLPPTVPARKPRTKLGQSSLATSNVLPVARTSNNNNNFSRSVAGIPPGRPNMDENSNVKRQGTVQETFRSLPVYLDDKDARLKTLGLPGDPPPITPRRKVTNDTNASYDQLKKPSTINEWLLDLGLPQYIANFYENGWDELDYIGSITDTDLVAMAIHRDEHRTRIMKSVRDMMPQ